MLLYNLLCPASPKHTSSYKFTRHLATASDLNWMSLYTRPRLSLILHHWWPVKLMSNLSTHKLDMWGTEADQKASLFSSSGQMVRGTYPDALRWFLKERVTRFLWQWTICFYWLSLIYLPILSLVLGHFEYIPSICLLERKLLSQISLLKELWNLCLCLANK